MRRFTWTPIQDTLSECDSPDIQDGFHVERSSVHASSDPNAFMKILSLRSLLLLAVAIAITANILWRIPSGSSARSSAEAKRAETWGAANILPTAANLPAMARQWKERLATLPPEERKASEARLREETRFFVEAQFLPAEERHVKIRERIEGLMNDPGLQADWAGERMKMLAGLTPEKRHEILKKYVQSKKEKNPTP
jgi:hypothetical protein